MLLPHNSGRDADFVAIARIRKPVGLKGFCYVNAFGATLDVLKTPCEIIISSDDTGKSKVILEKINATPKGYSCKFEGFEDRDQAETLRDALILIREDKLPQLDSSEYYHFELEGMKIISLSDSRCIGTVKEIHNYPTTDAIEIIQSDGKQAIIPFTEEIIKQVDKDSNQIMVDDSFLEEIL